MVFYQGWGQRWKYNQGRGRQERHLKVVVQELGLWALAEAGGGGGGSVFPLSSGHCLDQYPQPLAAESSNASRGQQRARRAQASPGSRTSRGHPRDQEPEGLDLVRLPSCHQSQVPAAIGVSSSSGKRARRPSPSQAWYRLTKNPKKRFSGVPSETNYFQIQTANHPNIIGMG